VLTKQTSNEQILFSSETLRKNLLYLEKDKVQVKNDYKKNTSFLINGGY
jgi:hypothetical protein